MSENIQIVSAENGSGVPDGMPVGMLEIKI